VGGDKDTSVPADVITSVDRRGEMRVTAELEVEFQSIDEVVSAYTKNISRGGIFVATDEMLPIGAVVKIKLALPDEESRYDAIARVAHLQSGDGEDPRGMGFELMDVGGAPLADRIARFLAAEGVEETLPEAPAAVIAKVLVVDDDEEYRELVAGLISESGHRTDTAKNGLDALRKAVADPPDLIVTDIHMPALDGWQFARLVRARPTLADVPIVFFSTHMSDEERLRGYQLGVSDYIGKPFDNDEFTLRIQRVLERSRAYPRQVSRNGGLQGDLSQVSLGRVLTLLASEQREGMLLLVGREEIATLYLREGNVVRVDLPEHAKDKKGVDRLYHVLDWTTGRFEFNNGEVREEDSIGTPTVPAILGHAEVVEDD
jgi:uncharacterized protein (TIGR02266 family)